MTDTTPQPILPPIIANNLASVVRIIMSGAAAWLVHDGLITNDQSISFVTVGGGIVVGGITMAWAWWQNQRNAKQLVAAAATGNPEADIKSPSTKAAIVAAVEDPSSPIKAKGATT